MYKIFHGLGIRYQDRRKKKKKNKTDREWNIKREKRKGWGRIETDIIKFRDARDYRRWKRPRGR